jgi:uncharacterized protein with NAD-binding domain and iron-sulfur cluster
LRGCCCCCCLLCGVFHHQVRQLFPSARNLNMTWHSIVKIGQSLYREAPGMDPYRPDQTTPVPNFFLAGSYTKQVSRQQQQHRKCCLGVGSVQTWRTGRGLAAMLGAQACAAVPAPSGLSGSSAGLSGWQMVQHTRDALICSALQTAAVVPGVEVPYCCAAALC